MKHTTVTREFSMIVAAASSTTSGENQQGMRLRTRDLTEEPEKQKRKLEEEDEDSEIVQQVQRVCHDLTGPDSEGDVDLVHALRELADLFEAREKKMAKELQEEKEKGKIWVQDIPRVAKGELTFKQLTEIEEVLQDRLKQVQEQKNKQLSCKICFEAEVDALFLECSHFCCCMNCARSLDACPICRTATKGPGGVRKVIKS